MLRAIYGNGATATSQCDIDAIRAASETLEDEILASVNAGESAVRQAEQKLKEVGEQLFDAIFSGDVEVSYRTSAALAVRDGEKLRIVLRITEPQLQSLPWEVMFDRDTGESTGQFVSRNEPLVRHVESLRGPEAIDVHLPLRILGVVASPSNMPTLDAAAEQRRLSDQLAKLGPEVVELHWVQQATWESLHDELLSGTWDVLHFIGHGEYDAGSDQAMIILVDADGGPNLVAADRLADLVNEKSTAPRLVVLNSCESGRTGTRDLFSSAAASFIRRGTSAVAAMQFSISDAAALTFCQGFYRELGKGGDVDDAVQSGRFELLGDSLEWVTPVLYVRGESMQLFNVARGSTPERTKRGWWSDKPDQDESRRGRWTSKPVLIATVVAVVVAVVATFGIVRFLDRPQPFRVPYTVQGQGLVQAVNVRAAPHKQSAIVARRAPGSTVFIICSVSGEPVTGPAVENGQWVTTAIWDKIRDQANGDDIGYMADVYINTGMKEPVGPPC